MLQKPYYPTSLLSWLNSCLLLSGQEVKNWSSESNRDIFHLSIAWTGALRETKNIGPHTETDTESEMHFVANTVYILKKNKGRGVRR